MYLTTCTERKFKCSPEEPGDVLRSAFSCNCSMGTPASSTTRRNMGCSSTLRGCRCGRASRCAAFTPRRETASLAPPANSTTPPAGDYQRQPNRDSDRDLSAAGDWGLVAPPASLPTPHVNVGRIAAATTSWQLESRSSGRGLQQFGMYSVGAMKAFTLDHSDFMPDVPQPGATVGIAVCRSSFCEPCRQPFAHTPRGSFIATLDGP